MFFFLYYFNNYPCYIYRVAWRDDGCNAKDGVAAALELHDLEHVDVILGPTCSDCTHNLFFITLIKMKTSIHTITLPIIYYRNCHFLLGGGGGGGGGSGYKLSVGNAIMPPHRTERLWSWGRPIKTYNFYD